MLKKIALRVLLTPVLLYAFWLLYLSIDHIPHWLTVGVDYSLARHWPVISLNAFLLLIGVFIWQGNKIASVVLGCVSVAYTVYVLVASYWPMAHVPYGLALLIISYLAFHLKDVRPNKSLKNGTREELRAP